MEVAEVKRLFAEFSTNFDSEYHDQVWENQSKIFQQFWKTKILNANSELTASDIEEIVRLQSQFFTSTGRSDLTLKQIEELFVS